MKQHIPEQPTTILVDGPAAADEPVVIQLSPLTEDGRSPLAETTTSRPANYGEADLKISKWISVNLSALNDGVTEWRTIDTGALLGAFRSADSTANRYAKMQSPKACCSGQTSKTFRCGYGFHRKERIRQSRWWMSGNFQSTMLNRSCLRSCCQVALPAAALPACDLHSPRFPRVRLHGKCFGQRIRCGKCTAHAYRCHSKSTTHPFL